METLIQDLRFALRSFWKKPGMIVVAVLMLGLGIGANTALFSVTDALLLKKLPVKDPEQLVLFDWESGKDFRIGSMRGTFIPDFYPKGRRGGSSFQPALADKMKEMAAKPDSPMADLFTFADVGEVVVVADRQASVAAAQSVSGTYFSGLGVNPFFGRLTTREDDSPAASPTAVLGYQYWKKNFDGDPSAIGKQITVNKVSFTIIGVTGPEFGGALQIGRQPDISIPLSFMPLIDPESPFIDKPGKPAMWWLHVMGRLKPGATREQAFGFLNTGFQELALSIMPPPRRADQPATVQPQHYPILRVREGARGMLEMRLHYSSTVYLLFGVVAIVLVIACANVANLLLARASERAGEITVRLAVGAGRRRILRQLVTESLLLSFLGGLAGIVFALWGNGVLAGYGRGEGALLPRNLEYAINWRVLVFTFVTMTLTGFLFGIIPAWRASGIDLVTTLKEKNRFSLGRSRLTRALVVGQVALSLVLLFGAGLTIRTVRNLQQTRLGFNPDNLLVFSLSPEAGGYKKERLAALYNDLLPRAAALPGVKSATFSRIPLVAHFAWNEQLVLPGETVEAAGDRVTNMQMVNENYLATMQIPLTRGRNFTPSDNEKSQPVAIVSETFAKKYFPNGDALGKRIGFDKETLGKIEIVGVADDVKYNSQKDEDGVLTYRPWQQQLDNMGSVYFYIRTEGNPLAIAPSIRALVRELDPTLPVTDVKTQNEQLSETMTEDRIFAQLLSFFGTLALVLAALGLYGVLAYSVSQRTSEIGIRMALGAQKASILRLVVWQGMKLVTIGLVIGGIGSYFAKKLIESRLYGVTATDPLTLAGVAFLLVATALVACLLPARRAAQADPMSALRHE